MVRLSVNIIIVFVFFTGSIRFLEKKKSYHKWKSYILAVGGERRQMGRRLQNTGYDKHKRRIEKTFDRGDKNYEAERSCSEDKR